jgi:DNA-binding GntR family transcriptional regulator
VYLFLYRRVSAAGGEETEVSQRELSESTGLSRRAVQDALTRLADRRLIAVQRETITAVSRYTVLRPWIR